MGPDDKGEFCFSILLFRNPSRQNSKTKLSLICVFLLLGLMRLPWRKFKARPIYLQKKDRTKAHFITCCIALFVFRVPEKKLGGKYTCEEIMNTPRTMMMTRPGEKFGYTPSYKRTDLTNTLHEAFGFRTDYEITTNVSMKK